MLRTFIAVEISEALHNKTAELIRAMQTADADVKWVDSRNQHLTLQFLGDVANEQIPQIAQAVTRGVESIAPFTLTVAGAGAFPNVHKPRTIWLGVKEGAERIVALHDSVASALAKIGIRDEERRYQAHLTIGRVRGFKNLSPLCTMLRNHADFIAGENLVDRVVLFSSQLQSGGPIYTPLATAVFPGPAQ